MNRKDKKARKEAAPRPQVRPQPVRDDILAYLTKPRHAYEIAAHTGRRTATITGHMQAMLRLKLVERVAYGVYARAGTLDASPPPAALVRPHPTRERILAFLTEPRHVSDIAAHLDRPRGSVAPQLRAMIDHGLVRRVRRSVFDRAHPDLLAPSDNQEFVAAA
ncbi:helix-turn-helix domain-containing protein (plasmid) [Roseomonas mucosa]|nr:helix-turn-helix domain-containing protein [Roseomonas mucosa]